jgi:hypothetical protein
MMLIRPISPIAPQARSRTTEEDRAVVVATVGIKALAKLFAKGINRFDVAYELEGERVATEVILDIQF